MRLPLQSLFERRDFLPMDSALARVWGGANVQTSAGVGVSEDSALNIAAFWRGVQVLSGALAAMPLHLYKGARDGTQTRFTGSKLYKLLHDNPNPEMTAFSFREALQAHLLTWGNAFAEIERNTVGQPIGLWPITPDRVVFYRDLTDARLKYRLAPTGKIIEAADMLHVPGLGFDGLIGYSVIARARQSLGLMVAAERYGSTFFGNGASFGGILESPDDMDKPQRDDLRKEITDFHQGPDRAHRFLILWNGLKYSKLAMAPEEAQFLQTRKMQIVEIARWLGVPPEKLYETDGRTPTAGSIEAKGIEYYTDTMLMWFEKWEQELNRKLIPSLEQNYQYFEFDAAGLMRADTQARYTAYNMGKQGGFLSADEIRSFENLGPIPNKGGDFYLAPLNMIPSDKFREYIDKTVNAKTAKKQPAPTPTAGGGGSVQDPQAAVDEAMTRAAAAEIAAAEARGKAEALQAEVVEMRARAVVPADQFAAVQRDLAAQIAVAEAATVLAAQMRQDAERAQHAAEGAHAARVEQEQRALAAEASIADALARQVVAETERDEARTLAGYATDKAADAQRELAARTSDLADVRQALDTHAADADRLSALHAAEVRTVETLRAELAAAVDGSTATVAHLRTELAAREAQEQALATDLTAAVARSEELARLLAEAQQRADAATAESTAAATLRAEHETHWHAADAAARAAETALADAQALLADAKATSAAAVAGQADERRARELAEADRLEAERLRTEADAARLAAETAAQEVAQRLVAAEQVALEARRASAAVDTRLAQSLANRRARLVHTMTRMVAIECERLQRSSGTPEKVRRWVETFYQNHEALCVRELQLTIEDHIINSGRGDDPDVLTRVLVRQHVEQSKREIAGMLDSVDPDGLTAAVYALCEHWQRDRVEAIANALLQDELDQIRSRLAKLPPEAAVPIRKRRVTKTVVRDADGKITGVVEEEEPEA